jgi:hypothetical protein
VNLRLGVSLPYDSGVAFTLRWNETNTGLPVKFTGVTPLPIHPLIDKNNENLSDTLVTACRPTPSRCRGGRACCGWGATTTSTGFVDEPDLGYVCQFGTCEFPQRLTVERREVEWLNHFHVGKWSTSTFGLEYRRETARSEQATEFDAESDTYSGFFQQTFRFFDRLFMSAGVRVEDNSIYGRNTTERGSLSYLIKEWGTRIRGGAGSGFRAPTFNDLFFPASRIHLKPETSFSYDFGVDQELWKQRIRLGLTYFRTTCSNLITFVFINTAAVREGREPGPRAQRRHRVHVSTWI